MPGLSVYMNAYFNEAYRVERPLNPDQKAMRCLVEHLSEAQIESLRCSSTIEVTGNNGGRWLFLVQAGVSTFSTEYGINYVLVAKRYPLGACEPERARTFCVSAAYRMLQPYPDYVQVPQADSLLGMILAVRSNEVYVERTANEIGDQWLPHLFASGYGYGLPFDLQRALG